MNHEGTKNTKEEEEKEEVSVFN